MGIFDKITDKLRSGLKEDIAEMLKSEADASADALPDKPADIAGEHEGDIGGKAIVSDPFFDQVTQHFIYKQKMSRLSHKTLKEVSMRDWLVSAIIQARVDTILRFSRPEHRRFEMGFHVVKRDKNEQHSSEDHDNIAKLEDFIYHCGRLDNTPRDQSMLFGEFMKLTLRDAMTFGHIAIEKVLTRRGGLHRFRPLPSESVYLVNQKTSREIIEREIAAARQQYETRIAQLTNDSDVVAKPAPRDITYFKYVQMSYDNRVLTAFGDEDMIFKRFNPQNFTDSMGYCYGPLELSIINITNHLNVENYNANFFTHGFASRGVLHLKGTVTPSNLANFRRTFYNSISGTQNAWRTPIIAGLDEVQWVPMSASAREMEYINFNHHLMRTICTQFQIDPVELGLDFLTTPNGRGLAQQSNEYKINYSRERGLYPILMFYEDMMNNDVIPALDKELAKHYEFRFTGYTDETPQTNIALLQAEMTVHASMNDLLKEAKRTPIDHVVADLPLNQTFWAIVQQLMTRGEIREVFLKDKDASKKRELQYLPGDGAFMAWQQLLLTMDQTKKQAEMQEKQMDAQQQQQQQEVEQKQKEHELEAGSHQREQEQHDMAMKAEQSRQAHAAVEGPQSIKDIAKQFGAASKPLEVGGKSTANPINALGKSEDKE